MLNIKKLLIVKAALFGLILSNTGIAAGAAGAGDAGVPAAAAPVVSTFLNSIQPIPAFVDEDAAKAYGDRLHADMHHAFKGGLSLYFSDISEREAAAAVQAGDLEEAQARSAKKGQELAAAEAEFAAIPAYPLNPDDRRIVKIFAEHIVGPLDGRSARFRGSLLAAYPAMEVVQSNLWIQLWNIGYRPGFVALLGQDFVGLAHPHQEPPADYRGALAQIGGVINAYRAVFAPAAPGAAIAMDIA